MKKYIAIYLIMLLVILLSCSNVSEDDLIDATPLGETVTYTANVKSIIDSNCILCHNAPPVNGAPMPLLTFEDVKNAVENRNLIGRISTQDLGQVMPFGGPRLPQALIDIVIQWETDGLLEN